MSCYTYFTTIKNKLSKLIRIKLLSLFSNFVLNMSFWSKVLPYAWFLNGVNANGHNLTFLNEQYEWTKFFQTDILINYTTKIMHTQM